MASWKSGGEWTKALQNQREFAEETASQVIQPRKERGIRLSGAPCGGRPDPFSPRVLGALCQRPGHRVLNRPIPASPHTTIEQNAPFFSDRLNIKPASVRGEAHGTALVLDSTGLHRRSDEVSD